MTVTNLRPLPALVLRCTAGAEGIWVLRIYLLGHGEYSVIAECHFVVADRLNRERAPSSSAGSQGRGRNRRSIHVVPLDRVGFRGRAFVLPLNAFASEAPGVALASSVVIGRSDGASCVVRVSVQVVLPVVQNRAAA